jgi:hypothetical protein
MKFPKPPFVFYRDCHIFGNCFNLVEMFGIGLYGTYTCYKRNWTSQMGSSACFGNFQTESYIFYSTKIRGRLYV